MCTFTDIRSVRHHSIDEKNGLIHLKQVHFSELLRFLLTLLSVNEMIFFAVSELVDISKSQFKPTEMCKQSQNSCNIVPPPPKKSTFALYCPFRLISLLSKKELTLHSKSESATTASFNMSQET